MRLHVRILVKNLKAYSRQQKIVFFNVFFSAFLQVTARDHGEHPLAPEKAIAVYVSVLSAAEETPPGVAGEESIQFITSPPAELAVSSRTPPGTVLYEVEIAPSNPVARWTFGLTGRRHRTPPHKTTSCRGDFCVFALLTSLG